MTAARLAFLIDPIQQARVVLGNTILPGLRAAMRPDATLAVGVTSAGGFLPDTGEAFLSTQRERLTTTDENLNDWQPFGVREVLRFLATGQEAPSIKIVSNRDLLVGNEVPCLGLSCGSGRQHGAD